MLVPVLAIAALDPNNTYHTIVGRAFLQSEQFLDQCSFGEYVEIGTSRQGDDGSTIHISRWARERDTRVITIDMDPYNCNFIKSKNLDNVEIHNTTGEKYLRERIYGLRPISFLYLDNFDWDHHPDRTEQFVLDQQVRYSELGFVMNNVNCQIAHLMQAELALPHMAERCVIACDDTPFNKWWGHYSGKCGAAVPYLLGHGFQVLLQAEDGIILGRGIQ